MRMRIIIGILLLLIQFMASAQNKFLFDHNEGLSNSLINQVIQDESGFIWVATEDGLNRFDGISFTTFFKNKHSEFSLNNTFVTSLVEDHDGIIWAGQIDGLQYYSPKYESFNDVILETTGSRLDHFVTAMIVTRSGDIWVATSGYGLMLINSKSRQINYLTQLNEMLCSNLLRCVFEDSDGVIWVGSENRGLNSYNPKTNEIRHYSEDGAESYTLASNNISCITEGERGEIFIGSLKGGLSKIIKNTGKIEQIFSNNLQENTPPVKSVLFDSKKRLWVGTDGFGLKQLNTKTNKLERYLPDYASFDFTKAKVHSLIEDDAGNIWAGIYQKGLFLLPEKNEIFNHYGYSAFGTNSIGSNSVTSIKGDETTLWIGTDGDGIYKINRSNNNVEHIVLLNNQGEKEGNNIISLHNTNDYLWIGTYLNGLIRYHKKSGSTRVFKNDPNNPHSLMSDNIVNIAGDADGRIWMGTLGGGICYYDPEEEKFYSGFDDIGDNNLSISNWVNSIFIDENQHFWLGSYMGLYYVNTDTKQLVLFSESDNTLINNTVFCTQTDSRGNVWVGTYGGLVKINPKTFKTTNYSTDDGLCNNVICGISEDEFGKIWISTHNGLSLFNPENEEFTNFYASDGLQSNEFSRNATFISENKELFFGGINGITEIKRNYQKSGRNIREVMLTDFMRFNKLVKIGEKTGSRTILNKSIIVADTVELRENDNFFSIGFSSVELAIQSRISYEYKMQGFDADWIATNSLNRRATYTNLKHGKYIFQVRGVDKTQRSEIRSLVIVIHPSWYKTKAAKILWVLLSFALFLGLVLLGKENLKRKHLEKMDEEKMQFFMNISHELKTPLTLILDPIDKLLAQKETENSRIYHIIHQNANRIFRLVNQLMDVRKIEKGNLLVKFQETNIYDFISKLAHSYDIMADSKSIGFDILAVDKNIMVWIDPLNFEKIISNLLSNAFKFTVSEGMVEIKISTERDEELDSEHLKIEVFDTGIGIKEKDIDRIFNRFYQVDGKDSNHPGGTGIGLHLSRSLVKIHKGNLVAKNRTDGSGSIFTITLPLGNEHLPPGDLIIKENIIPTPSQKFVSKYLPEELNQSTKPKTNYIVMVVEDENQIRDYLAAELSVYYEVMTFENGKLAYDKLLEVKPDLIISDIMMPEMDGITLCKKIKNNIKLSHIPVILLTALSSDEKKVEGIETGADMYLTKPFNSGFLKTTIASILENRRKLFEQVRKEKGHYDIENIKMDSHDEILMQKVMSIIKDNISESDLNVEMLADGVGISRVHMHRKLKEITNQSARDFIKDIRMKQASYLLTNKKVNVSEVAYAVGYSNLSHFSNTFKAFYGVSPKEYAQTQQA